MEIKAANAEETIRCILGEEKMTQQDLADRMGITRQNISQSLNRNAKSKAMALLEVKTEWAVYKDCFLQVARYQADNSRAIEIWNNEDGLIARITVCIAGSGLAEDETVIDTNNCPWAMEFIKQHGFGQATGRMVRSGYCTYPVVKLDIEKIGEYLEVH